MLGTAFVLTLGGAGEAGEAEVAVLLRYHSSGTIQAIREAGIQDTHFAGKETPDHGVGRSCLTH